MIDFEELEKIKRLWNGCMCCDISKYRRNLVHFRTVGNFNHADILFIGEAPGVNEDRQGEPFVGESGNLISDAVKQAIDDAGIVDKKNFTYVFTNVVACRPCESRAGSNRPPTEEEARNCRPHLEQIVKAVDPTVIVYLGWTAQKQAPAAIDKIGFLGLTYHIPHPSWICRRGGRKSSEYQDYVIRLTEIVGTAYDKSEEQA